MNINNLFIDWKNGQSQGLSLGDRASYKPWIDIQKFHSRTARFRVACSRLNRVIHLMSYGELAFFFRLEWDENIRDIKEQIALEPTATLAISDRLGYKHPGYTKGGMVMTSDFLIYKLNNYGEESKTAFQVKQSREELTDRMIEKIEIERDYWQGRGVDFKVVFSSELNRVFSANLSCLYGFRQLSVPNNDIKVLFRIAVELISSHPRLPFSSLPTQQTLRVPSGAVYSHKDVIQTLCAKKYLSFPITSKLLKCCFLNEFKRTVNNV